MQIQDLSEYIHLSKDALELLKSAYSILPTGKDKESALQKIAQAEALLKRADAKLAEDLGYRLCQCEFPPRPMLWKEKQKSYVCQNPDCGKTISTSSSYRPAQGEYF